jgi:hypothetical protein
LTKADDISDFEIEGMSIGDSLLDYFSKEEIDEFYNYDHLPSDMKFRIAEIYNGKEKNMLNYSGMQLYYKPNDINFILHSVTGGKFCSTEIECKNLYEKIKEDLLKSFTKGKEETHKSNDDPTGKSKSIYYQIELDNGSIYVTYQDWSKNVEWKDNVNVEVSTKDVDKWNRNNFGLGVN